MGHWPKDSKDEKHELGVKAIIVIWGEALLLLALEVVRSARSWAGWLWVSHVFLSWSLPVSVVQH